ncbi:MAG: SusC/RagA family TonB-linked outer membrane protein, partial [Bacteroidales bacterium]
MENQTKPAGIKRQIEKLLLKMKLTLTILMFCLAGAAASTYSQNTRLDVKIENGTMVELIKQIEAKSEFMFYYQKHELSELDNLTVEAHNATVMEILDKVTRGTVFDYTVIDRYIVVRKVGDDFGNDFLATAKENVAAQQPSVSGKVTDSNNQPLPGVTVIVAGTTTGTVTDADGNFSLAIPPTAETLQFSFVGMRTQEVPIEGRTAFTVVMEEDVIGLEEVVAVGYGTMRKSDLTGAVVRAGQEIINERPNVSVMQSLRGALPGLNIGQTNEAGAEPNISIRGQTSISGESAPLIVVDNIIFRGNLIDINPNDIETIDILKDASSAAIYGSQATNGVIIITTTKKGGKIGKPVINFSSSYSFDSPAKELNLESPEEFIQRMKDADLYNSRTEESGYLEPNPDYDVTTRFRANPQIDAYRAGIVTDWYSILVNENMHTQNHNLSLSNQTQNSGYYISLGYTEQVGYMHNEGYSRWNARINADNTVTDWLNVGVQTFMTLSDYSGQSIPPGNIYSFHWYAPAYTPDGELEENPDGLNINPLYVFDVDDLDKRMNLFGNIYADIKIPFIKGLTFKTNYSTNYRIVSKYFYRPYAQSFQGTGSKTETIGNDWSNDNILSYKNTIDRIHRLDITLVYGVEQRNSSYTQANATNFISDELGYNRLQAGSADQQTVSSGAWEEKSLYSMARLFYGLKEKYLITGTIRRDGFSGFSEKNKFGLFPSLSLAWVLSEEKIFKESLNWLDFLKLRLSYGSNGNRTIGRYQTLARVGGGYNYIDASKSSIYTQATTELASPNLKWETTTGINLGIDYSIINQRVSGSVEYYNSNTRDLLYNVD